MRTKYVVKRKRTDEELICECGHIYHDHAREVRDDGVTEFGHNGPCEYCTCDGYKEAGQ